MIQPGYSLEEAIDAFADVLSQNDLFVVASHVNPDGDAIGALVAMGLFLESLGKRVALYNRDPVPQNFLFLPGATQVDNQLPFIPDVTILVDCAAPPRIGDDFPVEGWGETVVVVDHHKTFDPEFADLYIRDVSAASAGEVVYALVKRYGTLSHDIAQAIYACILTDTNCFRYSATCSKTFDAAGEMLDAGVDPWYMSSNIYESQPVERVQLLAQVLQTLTISEDGTLASLFVSRDLIKKHGATDDLVDGFINYARGIQGVEVATQMMEEPNSQWRISFRSKGTVDVSKLAEQFGGGGHRNRAGCRIRGTKAEVQQKLSQALGDILKHLRTSS